MKVAHFDSGPASVYHYYVHTRVDEHVTSILLELYHKRCYAHVYNSYITATGMPSVLHIWNNNTSVLHARVQVWCGHARIMLLNAASLTTFEQSDCSEQLSLQTYLIISILSEFMDIHENILYQLYFPVLYITRWNTEIGEERQAKYEYALSVRSVTHSVYLQGCYFCNWVPSLAKLPYDCSSFEW